MSTRVLTGIKPTGSPHLGNYAGAIRPSIAASDKADVQAFFFLADYHALVACDDPLKVQRMTLEVAATWLALGLNPDRALFYRQSDIPEIPELTWLLTCVTGKGLLNRAHAYKAAVDANLHSALDPDHGINAGLYCYPVLMAADILLFNAHQVPVGKDQVQHIEIARDLAQRFNHVYGHEHFTLPEPVVDASSAVLPGLDGRKMSKSYDNTIGLWLSPSALKQAIAGIVTNSKLPEEVKYPDESALFAIYQAFASAQESAALAQQFHDGIAWGEVKAMTFARVEQALSPARERYAALIAQPAQVEHLLQAGAERARAIAQPFIKQLRHAVGLRPLTASAVSAKSPAAKKFARLSTFRDSEGFRFKLSASDGKTVLLESIAFEEAAACGKAMAALKAPDAAIAMEQTDGIATVVFRIANEVVANGLGDWGLACVLQELEELRLHDADK